MLLTFSSKLVRLEQINQWVFVVQSEFHFVYMKSTGMFLETD